MTKPHRLFIETVHHAAFRLGGWGIARDTAGAISGLAGGERNVTPARADLLALIEGLGGFLPGAVEVHSASPGVIAAARILAAPPAPGSDDAPTEDLDLWAQALKAAQGRTLTVKPAAPAATTFLKAWAEVGQDKAKMKGRFSAPIPKPNLAKLVLG